MYLHDSLFHPVTSGPCDRINRKAQKSKYAKKSAKDNKATGLLELAKCLVDMNPKLKRCLVTENKVTLLVDSTGPAFTGGEGRVKGGVA